MAKEIRQHESSSVPTGRRLEDLEPRWGWMSYMACLRAASDYHRLGHSDSWIYGGSGYAFVLNIHEAICPSGPTAWPEHWTDLAAVNIGLFVERFAGPGKGKHGPEVRQAIWRAARRAIDDGDPVFGWELDKPEFYVVYGYDADGNYLFHNVQGPDKLHWDRLGDTGIGWAMMAAVARHEPAGERRIVADAIEVAIEVSRRPNFLDHPKYRMGLAAYDAWIAALQDESLVASNKEIGFGHAYNAQCWAECRQHAFGFLVEARNRLKDSRLSDEFAAAIKHYQAVAANLRALAEMYPFHPDQAEEMTRRLGDKDRRARAVARLQAARGAEAKALEALARLHRKLDPSP